jgi:drug/metabolite transporter (DMT)-like permease
MTVPEPVADVEPVAAGASPLPSAETSRGRFYIEAGYAFAAIGALLFSTKGIAIKLAYRQPIDATLLLTLRMALAVPIYAVIAAFAVAHVRRRGVALPSRTVVLQAALVGALGYWLASYLDFAGLQFISAQFERLILFTYPLFVVIFGALFFGLPMRLKAVAAIGLSYIGLAVIFLEKIEEPGSEVAMGAALVLGSALAFAMYQLIAKGVIAKLGPRLFTCIAMTGAGIAVFAQFLATRPIMEIAAVSPRVWEISLFLAVGATVLPSFFLNAALHRISAQANATIGTLSPVMTVVLSGVRSRRAGDPHRYHRHAVVLAGVGWFTLAERRR